MAWFWPIIQSLIRLSASFSSSISKCYMKFDTKLEDWIKRYLIQTYHRLSQEYFKSCRIAFRVALWLDFEQLSSYVFVYRRLFRATISKCYMEFDTKSEDWIKRYPIQTYHRLSQEYFRSYKIPLGWLYGLFCNNYPVTHSFFGFFVDLRRKYITWNLEFDLKLKDWINRYLIETWQRLF